MYAYDYLKCDCWIKFFKSDVLHFSINIGISTSCIMLWPLHLTTKSDKSHVHVTLLNNIRNFISIFKNSLHYVVQPITYVIPCCLSSFLNSGIMELTNSLKTFSLSAACSTTKITSASFLGILTLNASPTVILFCPSLQLPERIFYYMNLHISFSGSILLNVILS